MKKFFSLFLSVIITASMLTANGISVYSYADETIGSSEESTGFSAADSDEDSDLDSDLDFDSDFEYSISDGSVIITKYIGSDTDVSVPSEIDGMPVTEIGERAFRDCTTLESITFPESIQVIGSFSFYDCSSLREVTFSDGLRVIGSNVFNGCTSLESVAVPEGVVSIGGSAFSSCTSLENISIPSTVTFIGELVFHNCGSLKSIDIDENNSVYSSSDGVWFDKDKTLIIKYPIGKEDTEYTIPDSVVTIGATAFRDCVNLTKIIIPNSVSDIMDFAFCNCDGLTEITIPDGVLNINSYTFYECDNLTRIAFHSSIFFIAEYVFYKCKSLRNVYYTGTVSEWQSVFIRKDGNSELFNAKKYYNCPLISLSEQDVILAAGQSYKLSAVVTPDDNDFILTWESSDTNIAEVNSQGEVLAVGEGTAIITVKLSEQKTAECVVMVRKVPQNIALNKTSLRLEEGQSLTLSAELTPSYAYTIIIWSSSDETVADVNENGEITAKKAGTAIITAETSNGKTAFCEVTVFNPAEEPERISINKSSIIVGVGETFDFICKTDKGIKANVTYSLSKKSVVTVDGNGHMTAEAVGTVIVTAQTVNGKTAKCRVTVRKAPTSISINRKNSIMGLGESFYLEGSLPSDEAARELTFSSNNESVATVNSGGIVTAKSNGTAIISITTYNGQRAACRVTVRNAPTSLTFNKTEITLKKGGYFYLESIFNTGEYARMVTYNSPNKMIAVISGSGVITAKSAGTVKITGKTYNGNTAVCTVTVQN